MHTRHTGIYTQLWEGFSHLLKASPMFIRAAGKPKWAAGWFNNRCVVESASAASVTAFHVAIKIFALEGSLSIFLGHKCVTSLHKYPHKLS